MFVSRARKFCVFLSIACASSLILMNAQAVSLDRIMDRHLVKEAELIFVGKIADIQYRSSTPQGQEEAPIPHTFVTFEIEKVLKGQSDQREMITLRFIGGLGDREETFLHASGVPHFDVGDSGVFFVRRNGIHICPLVGWQQGFIRFIDDMVISDLGEEQILIEDPVYAARIHPKDVRNYAAFIELLLKAQRRIDQMLLTQLSEVTQALLRNQGNMSNIDPRMLHYRLPEKTEPDFLPLRSRLLPDAYRQIPRSYTEAMLFRDLNGLLTQRNLFSDEDLREIPLRDQTRILIGLNRDRMSPEEVLLMNRRILEDAYPDLLIKSRNRTITGGRYHMHHEIMTYQVGKNMHEIIMAEPEEREGPDPEPDPIPEGRPLDADTFIDEIVAMVEFLHTPEELKELPAVQSQDPDKGFVFAGLRPVAPIQDFIAPDEVPVTDQEKFEQAFLRQNDGNPVIKQ